MATKLYIANNLGTLAVRARPQRNIQPKFRTDTEQRPTYGRTNPMTKQQAQAAMESGTKVEAGKGEDNDTGYIHAITGNMANVAWDSGVRTPCPIADLTIA